MAQNNDNSLLIQNSAIAVSAACTGVARAELDINALYSALVQLGEDLRQAGLVSETLVPRLQVEQHVPGRALGQWALLIPHGIKPETFLLLLAQDYLKTNSRTEALTNWPRLLGRVLAGMEGQPLSRPIDEHIRALLDGGRRNDVFRALAEIGAPEGELIEHCSAYQIVAQVTSTGQEQNVYQRGSETKSLINVTSEVLAMELAAIQTLSDHSPEASALVAELHEKSGQYGVIVEQSISRYFRASSLDTLTQQMLDEARLQHIALTSQ